MANDDGSGSTGPRAEGRSVLTQRRFAAFGERLNTAMQKAELTPADLSGHLRVSTQMIGKYLRGESLPGPARLQQLSEIVHVPLDELVKIADEHEPRRPRTPAAYALLHQSERERGDDTETQTRTDPRQKAPGRLAGWGGVYGQGSTAIDHLGNGSLALLASRLAECRDKEPDGYRQPFPKQIIADYLVNWARVAAPQARTDAEVAPFARVTGPFFRYSPPLMIVDDHGPVLAVEIMTSSSFSSWPSLVGRALNWKEATGGKPFFVVWLCREESFGRHDRTEALAKEAERTLISIKNAGLLFDWFIVDEDDPAPEMTRLTERLPGVIRETK